MDAKKKTRMFKNWIRQVRGKAASSTASVQSTSAVLPTPQPPAIMAIVPVEDEEPVAKRFKSAEGFVVAATSVLAVVSKETKAKDISGPRVPKSVKEVAELPFVADKLMVRLPPYIPFKIIRMGINWGVLYVLPWRQMPFYDGIWYPRYSGGIGIGYENPDATDIHVSSDDPSRHPYSELRHFHTSSLQSQSLDLEGGERLVDTLVDFLGAERALGAAESATEGAGRRRLSTGEAGDDGGPTSALRDEKGCSPLADDRSNPDWGHGGSEQPEEVERDQHEDAAVGAEEPLSRVQVVDSVVAVAEGHGTVGGGTGEGQQEGREEVLEAGVGTTCEAVPPLFVEGEDPVRPIGGEVLAVTPARTSPGHLPPGVSPRYISLDDLDFVVEKIMIKKLSNNWSLDAYRRKMEDTVKRSHDNKEAIGEVAQSVANLGKIIAEVQKTVADLGESSTGQDIIASKLRKDFTNLTEGHNLLADQVSYLHNSTSKLAEEAICHEADVKKMAVENSTKWSKHEIDHGGVNARLGSLEELRRLDNITRGQENTAELNNAFMRGFQRCLEVQIANGTFQRRLLENKTFMDLVKDKDGLLVKLSEKYNQFSWIGEPSQQ